MLVLVEKGGEARQCPFGEPVAERMFRNWYCYHVNVIEYPRNYGEVTDVLKKIEEVSKLSGISKRTLQYYDDEGILPAKRSEENYRLYDETAMEKLWKILWYKEMGFKLSEVKVILAVSEKETGELFEQKVGSTDGKIRDLENQRRIIRHIEQYGMIPVPAKKDKDHQTYKEQIEKIKEKIVNSCEMMYEE